MDGLTDAISIVEQWESAKCASKIIIGPCSKSLIFILNYRIASDHVEQPERVIYSIFELNKLWMDGIRWSVPKFRQFRNEDISYGHSVEYLDTLSEMSKTNPNYLLGAQHTCSTIIELIDQILTDESEPRYALAVTRPAGHHCSRNTSSGFGLINNIANGAKYIRAKYHKRVMILDWDIHYSGGTTEILLSGSKLTDDLNFTEIDSSIYLIDVFGARGQEIKEYTRKKYNRNWMPFEYAENATFINVSLLSDSAGDEIYLNEVWPEVERQFISFNPDILLVSCGFDAVKGDNEGFSVTPQGYQTMVERCKYLMSGKPILFALEGGYKPDMVAQCIASVISGLH